MSGKRDPIQSLGVVRELQPVMNRQCYLRQDGRRQRCNGDNVRAWKVKSRVCAGAAIRTGGSLPWGMSAAERWQLKMKDPMREWNRCHI